jgi:yecA family protein
MSGLSRRLKQLDEELLALGEETMLLEELDGFIAGLLVCPDLIKPGEWLPIIWNRISAPSFTIRCSARRNERSIDTANRKPPSPIASAPFMRSGQGP